MLVAEEYYSCSTNFALILCKTCMNDMAGLLLAYTCTTKSNPEIYRIIDMLCLYRPGNMEDHTTLSDVILCRSSRLVFSYTYIISSVLQIITFAVVML